ncbi:MAG TPA: thioredoxin domain-containing protein [Thermoanaerobaculia bacterium]|nr:thioredoxin domain-containing protein [Thermoanaerobaculia bacterium]
MSKRIVSILLFTCSLAWVAWAAPREEQAKASAPAAAGIERQLEAYALKFLPWDPQSKVTVMRSTESVTGFQAFKVKRTAKYERLNQDRVVFVSDDGKWFFAGDTLANATPRPVRNSGDLAWLDTKLSQLYHTNVRSVLTPDKDAGGLKALFLQLETGYMSVRMPGYVTPDGKMFLQGTVWDFKMDPRAERRRRIDLSSNRASGPADSTVNVVEYADMECGYCKFRGLQMDRLLAANSGIVNVRRHYKFFPLWMGHVWSMKAASAGDCLAKFARPESLFRFKEQVYARQESLNLSGIDELALTTAEAEGVSSADFLSCYLKEPSFKDVRADLEEGYRLGINSTPTYFVDGTEISWVDDHVMEDYLRTLFPKIRSISYEAGTKK